MKFGGLDGNREGASDESADGEDRRESDHCLRVRGNEDSRGRVCLWRGERKA